MDSLAVAHFHKTQPKLEEYRCVHNIRRQIPCSNSCHVSYRHEGFEDYDIKSKHKRCVQILKEGNTRHYTKAVRRIEPNHVHTATIIFRPEQWREDNGDRSAETAKYVLQFNKRNS
jgi:hypothetical protein